MTPQHDRCVLTRHDVQSIKDLVFIVGGNSESSAQKAIFEILSDNMRRSRPHPAPATEAQQRIEQAIKELEKEIADQKDLIAHTEGHHKEIHESILNTLGFAIALLQAGRK